LGLLCHTRFYTSSFGEVIKCFKQFDTLLNSCHRFKSRINDILIHNIKVFHTNFKSIKIFMPSTWSYIEYFILVGASDFFEVFKEILFDFFKDCNDFRAFGTSELGNLGIFTSSGKLKLTFTYFTEFYTSLNKCIDLGKDGIEIKIPFGIFIFLED